MGPSPDMFGQDVSAGLPTLREFEPALVQAEKLRKNGFLGEIHISVNATGFISPKDRLRAREIGVRVSEQAEDLGLYGNFRFLVHQASKTHFFWLANDDEPPWSILWFLESEPNFSREAILLTCANILVRGPGRADDSGRRTQIRWVAPPIWRDIFDHHPTHIFGLWNTEWVQRSFPDVSFDWLDVYLLALASKTGRIQVCPGSRRIGLRNGEPHRVNGRYHRVGGWAFHSGQLLRKDCSFSEAKMFIRNLFLKFLFSAKEKRRYLDYRA